MTSTAPEVLAATVVSRPEGKFPRTMDMTVVLEYERQLEEVTRVNDLTGPFYMQTFLQAMETVSDLKCKAVYEYESAQAATKRARSIAMLDKAPDWFKTSGMRMNEETLKAYVDGDSEYLVAKEQESYLKALVMYLGDKHSVFERAHDDARNIYKGTRDAKGQGNSVPSGRD